MEEKKIIVICGSMAFAKEMVAAKEFLESDKA